MTIPDEEAEARRAFYKVAIQERDLARLEVQRLTDELQRARGDADRSETRLGAVALALQLVAAPKRADGTYNRSREACEILARRCLEWLKETESE